MIKALFTKKLFLVTIFSVAMAFLESAVVVYLREIYYPDGFDFPLVSFSADILLTEILREVATLIMLVCVGLLAGKISSTIFAWFLYSFAIWDIFYYVFLKLLIDWPDSFMTYDILFLVPATWVGPVVTPVIVSLTMILFSQVIIFYRSIGRNVIISRKEWSFLILGAVVLILAFIWDYCAHMLEIHSLYEIITWQNNREVLTTAQNYIPQRFNWILFISGQCAIFIGILIYWRRMKHPNK